jgi:hypothetical protein
MARSLISAPATTASSVAAIRDPEPTEFASSTQMIRRASAMVMASCHCSNTSTGVLPNARSRLSVAAAQTNTIEKQFTVAVGQSCDNGGPDRGISSYDKYRHPGSVPDRSMRIGE